MIEKEIETVGGKREGEGEEKLVKRERVDREMSSW